MGILTNIGVLWALSMRQKNCGRIVQKYVIDIPRKSSSIVRFAACNETSAHQHIEWRVAIGNER